MSRKLILSKLQKSTLDILYPKSNSSNNTSNDNTEDEGSQDSNYNFQPFSTSGQNMASRYHHKTITFDNHLFVFGGCDKINPKKAKTFYHTIDKLDLTTKKWSSLTNTEVKSNEGERKTNSKVLLEFPRVIFHSAILIDCVVYIFGGIDEYFQPQRDVLTFDLQNNKISSLPGSMLLSSFIAQNVFDVQYENQPSALFFSSSFVKSDKKRIIEEAENNNSEDKLIKDEEKPTFDTLNLYFPKKQQFQHISIENGISPPLLHFYSSVHSNNQIYIFGGSNTHFIWSGKKKLTNELYIFDILSMTFSNPKTTGTPPSPRMGHTMAIIDEKLFVFGGTDEEGNMKNDLYILYLLSFTWKKFSNFPSVPRTFHSSYSLLSSSVFSFYFIGGTKSAQIDQFSYNTSLPLLFSAETPSVSNNNNNQSSGAQNGSIDSSKSSDNFSSSPPNSSPFLDRSEKEEEEDEEKLKARREEEKRMEEENKVLIEYISHLNDQTNYVIKELLQITTITNNPQLITDQLHDRSLRLSRFTSQLLDPFEYHKFAAMKSQTKSPQFINLSNNNNNVNNNNETNNVFCKSSNALKEIDRLSSKTPPKDLFQTLRTLTLPEKQLSSTVLTTIKDETSTVLSPRSKVSKSYSVLPDISSLTISRSRSRTSSNNLSLSNPSSILQSSASPKKTRSLQKSKSKGGKGTEKKVNSPTVSEFLDVSLSCLKSLDIPSSKSLSSPLLFSTSSTTSVNRSRSSHGYHSRSPSPRRIPSSSSFQQLITTDSSIGDTSKNDIKEEKEPKADNKRDSKRESRKLLLDKSNEESREEKKILQIDERYLEYRSILKRFARAEISFIKRLSMVVGYLILPLSNEYRPWVSSHYPNAKNLFNLFQKIMNIFDFHSQFISQLLPLFDLLPPSFNDQNNDNSIDNNTIEESKNVVDEESKIDLIKGNLMKIIEEFSSKFERVKTVYSKFQSSYIKNNEYLLDFLNSKFDNLKQLILSSVQSHFYQFQFDNYYPFLIKRVKDYSLLLKRITDLHCNDPSFADIPSTSETVQQKYRDLFSSLSIG